MIKSETECRKATESLGITFVRAIRSTDFNAIYYPSGCYYEGSTYLHKGYFNYILDVSTTFPGHFGSYAGVCKNLGNQCHQQTNRCMTLTLYFFLNYVVIKMAWFLFFFRVTYTPPPMLIRDTAMIWTFLLKRQRTKDGGCVSHFEKKIQKIIQINERLELLFLPIVLYLK